jgi:hypothetical protein
MGSNSSKKDDTYTGWGSGALSREKLEESRSGWFTGKFTKGLHTQPEKIYSDRGFYGGMSVMMPQIELLGAHAQHMIDVELYLGTSINQAFENLRKKRDVSTVKPFEKQAYRKYHKLKEKFDELHVKVINKAFGGNDLFIGYTIKKEGKDTIKEKFIQDDVDKMFLNLCNKLSSMTDINVLCHKDF